MNIFIINPEQGVTFGVAFDPKSKQSKDLKLVEGTALERKLNRSTDVEFGPGSAFTEIRAQAFGGTQFSHSSQ